MTLRELNELVRKHGLSEDAELMVQPLLKDKTRKVTSVSMDAGKMVLRCNVISRKRKG